MQLQDRFTSLVPALSKYGSVTVGVTLLVIGVGGLYENFFEGAELADEPQAAYAGQHPFSLVRSTSESTILCTLISFVGLGRRFSFLSSQCDSPTDRFSIFLFLGTDFCLLTD